MGTREHVGVLLRSWRQRRRQRTQLELALDAEISQRHLSFVESGRASPSREMLLRLANRLDVPLRDRNALLIAVFGTATEIILSELVIESFNPADEASA